MAEININVNPADDNDYNQNKAQNHFDSLINDISAEEQMLEYVQRRVKEEEAVLEKLNAQQKQMDKLLDTDPDTGTLESVVPSLSPEDLNKVNKAGRGSSASDDVVLAQRIENLDRTIGSKQFRNQSVQLDPFFENLRSKSSKQTSQEDLDKLIQTEVDKQLANINDVETSLFNSIDLMNAQIEAKIQNLEAKMAKDNSDPSDSPKLQEYQQFQDKLSSLREDVSGYISESVDKIKESAGDYAKTGYDEGETARIIASADKEQKRVEKLVASFNKDFDKYIDQQKKEIAKDYAFNTAQAYLDTTKDAKMDVAKKIYANAYQDFIDNAPVQSHGLSDEEIAQLHAATGGNINPADVHTQPTAPPVQTGQGGGGGSHLPPGGRGTGDFNNYQGPPNNNASSLTNPNQPGGNGHNSSSKIGIHMLLSEVTQAIINPLTALAAIPTDIASAHLQHLSWASTKERIQTPQLVRSMGKTAQKNTEAITGATGAVIGGTLGAMAGGIGALPGAFVGGALGDAAGKLIPIETISNMVGYLYEIAQNTGKQAEAFSPELMQSNIDKQLAFLEANIDIGTEMGAELASLNDATADLQLTFYKEAIELVRPMLPLMTQAVKLLERLIDVSTESMTVLFKFLTNDLVGMFTAIASILNRPQKKKPLGMRNQMDQLEDNVPFLP